MQYELMFILRPDLTEEELKAKIEEVKKLIADGGGEVIKEEAWGKRALAYPIKHCAEGVYHLLNFQSQPSLMKDLEKTLNLDDGILRFLAVHGK